ncbi:hypothetical protein EXIGLDRAFT_835879 [Exidia glandulosa HHB12029]|uniref:F-box domain-containing protein n=1 Tax=Exidia glandulosa HHB12029 TaxID=1314781 RepID=A0A165ID86_EXIGL|nr:hypothetical protein EXIGLDRAFT_835879 [Exidia glandulosa HHB12029]
MSLIDEQTAAYFILYRHLGLRLSPVRAASVHRSTLQAVSRIARRINDNGPIARLPRNIFCSVFALYIDLRDLVRATGVCHVWRDALMHDPSVWTVLSNYEVVCPPGVLTRLLSLSSTLPLHLELEATDANWPEVCESLEVNLQRCLSLSVTFNSHNASVRLTAALCGRSAPILRTFKLFDPFSWFNSLWDRDDGGGVLFAGDAPHLELVKIHTDLTNVRPSSALRAVKRLRCANASSWEDDSNASGNVVRILDLFPRVEILALEVRPDSRVDASQELIKLPPLLTDVVVDISLTAFSASNINVMRRFKDPDLPSLRGKISGECTPEQCLSHMRDMLAGTAPSALELWSRGPDIEVFAYWDPSCQPVDGREFDRGSYQVSPKILKDLLPSDVFANVTWLGVAEDLFGHDDVQIPAMRAVTRLCVSLLYGPAHRTYGAQSMFLLPPDKVFSFPLLKTLAICAASTMALPSGGYITWLTPDLVSRFIRSHLRYDAPRIGRLIFEGASGELRTGGRGFTRACRRLRFGTGVDSNARSSRLRPRLEVKQPPHNRRLVVYMWM